MSNVGMVVVRPMGSPVSSVVRSKPGTAFMPVVAWVQGSISGGNAAEKAGYGCSVRS
jgi:hypothetical protein